MALVRKDGIVRGFPGFSFFAFSVTFDIMFLSLTLFFRLI
jgi:hypothetical protein